MRSRVVTSIVPPRLTSWPQQRSHLEYSSRSIVFARDGPRLLRAWGDPDRPWLLAVEPDGGRWRVEARGAGPGEARRAAREMFSLDHPLEAFYRLARREPTLRGTEREFRGLRIPRDASLYEALLHSIVGQQLSVPAANALKRRLWDRWGSTLPYERVQVPCVPRPRELERAGIDELRSVGMSRAKAGALGALARWARRAPPSAEQLSREPLAEAVGVLDALPGVGRWTAENALLRGAGRPDVFVAGDLGVRVALEEYRAVPRSAPEKAARAWAERHYPGWGSYATLYLWAKLSGDRRARRAG